MASQLVFNLASGSVSCGFTLTAAQELQLKLNEIVRVLKAKTISGESGKPKPQPPIEYQYTGDVFLEIFCNPNIWANVFVAKVSITLRDDRIRLSSEAELTRIIEDVERFIEHFD
jgi:ubiquinone/menaquinone biosynthesis C-methylase UbiE